MFKECYRILKPKGYMRIVVPDITKFIDAFENKDLKFMQLFKDRNIYKHDSWLRIIVRQVAEPVVNNYSDEDLYKIFKRSTNLKKLLQLFLQEQSNICKNKNSLINFFLITIKIFMISIK